LRRVRDRHRPERSAARMSEWLNCIACDREFEASEIRYECDCGGLLTVSRNTTPVDVRLFDERLSSRSTIDRSGVWRFREAVMDVPNDQIITHPEGATRLYERDGILFKHEGENPTGSFKDRGMTVAMTQAMRVGSRAVACASTGNTSASLAAYAAQAGLQAVVFIPAGKVAAGKLAQTLAYGATCLEVKGDFDAAMTLVREASRELGIYLVNSINPFRLEGQKTIVWELLQDLSWHAPDWIVVPAGNLGNTSAFGKALREAHESGWIQRVPRIAAIQAEGANPFYRSWKESFATRHRMSAETVASAIRIGDPVSHDRAVAAIRYTNGVVEQVTDAEIMAAKSEIDRMGIGCEPASAATLAGVKKLRAAGVMRTSDRTVCILTGHVLKDPDAILRTAAGRTIAIEPTLAAVRATLSTPNEKGD
jgi:threonine synthase